MRDVWIGKNSLGVPDVCWNIPEHWTVEKIEIDGGPYWRLSEPGQPKSSIVELSEILERIPDHLQPIFMPSQVF